MFLSGRPPPRPPRPSAPWPRRGGRGALRCSVPACRPPPRRQIQPPRPPRLPPARTLRSSSSSPTSNPSQTMPPAPDPRWPMQCSPQTSSSSPPCRCSRPRARRRPSPSPRSHRTTRIRRAVAFRIRRRNPRLVWTVGRGARFPRRACANGTPRGGGSAWRIRPSRRFAVALEAFGATTTRTRTRRGCRPWRRRRARRRPPPAEMPTEPIAQYRQRIESCPNE
mmetsp:Transcript_33857/g.62238  ORF Transcript_33857/g.62238 Transcript_33857/m.62238 type:complete len:223 (+) Transcript_33857:769-1437(+)